MATTPTTPDLGLSDYRRFAPPPQVSDDVYRAGAVALLQLLDAVDAGDLALDGPELDRLAAPLAIVSPLRHDRRTLAVAPGVPDLELLVRMATEHDPSAAWVAPPAVLGPFAEALDHRREVELQVVRVATAAWAFCARDDFERTLAQGWERQKPRPPVELRAQVRAVSLAPWGVYSLGWPEADDQWRVRDRVGLSPTTRPPGMIRVPPDRIGTLGEGVLAGDSLVARVVPVADGWTAALGLVVPGPVPETLIRRALLMEGLRARVENRRATLEDVLRSRGHHVVRRLCEWAWTLR